MGDERNGTPASRSPRAAIAAVGNPHTTLVDLRANTGGKVWPMLTVLVPLLGDGRLGSFIGPDDSTTHWEIRDSDVVLAGKVKGTNPQRLTRPAPPVAALMSLDTASSGEATVLSFLGLARVRTFGSSTAGFSTSNEPFVLSDLTTAVMADRTGRRYGGSIFPDVLAPAGKDVDAAKAWLASQPGCG